MHVSVMKTLSIEECFIVIVIFNVSHTHTHTHTHTPLYSCPTIVTAVHSEMLVLLLCVLHSLSLS